MQDLSPAADTAIAARKAPPIDEGPTPGADCGGCYLEVINLIPTGATIRVAAFDTNDEIAYACPENTLKRFERLISAPGNYEFNGNGFAGNYRLAFKRVSSIMPYVRAKIRCRKQSTLDGKQSHELSLQALSEFEYIFSGVNPSPPLLPNNVSYYSPGCWITEICPQSPNPGL